MPPDAVNEEEAVISGYLYKKSKEGSNCNLLNISLFDLKTETGRWHKRWFKTNDAYLTYYRTRKMEKLLAALSLPQVGEIKILPAEEDPEHNHGLFIIDLNSRIYTLRAKSDSEAEVWVKTLNAIRQDEITKTNLHKSQRVSGMEVRQALESKDGLSNATWVKSDRRWCGCC